MLLQRPSQVRAGNFDFWAPPGPPGAAPPGGFKAGPAKRPFDIQKRV